MEVGNTWGEWKVEKSLGEGSFGKVFKIVREDFGNQYIAALKVIEIPQNQSEYATIKSEGLSDESVQEYYKSVVEDLVNEFALMAKMKGNSNIVSYEDHAVVPKETEYGWEILIRMELLTPLYVYMDEHTLSVDDVIRLGIDMCKALEVCEKYHIIHRDIKPENIFVSDIGTFKLGDFGIARQLENASSVLSRKGTYTYMAPEVYRGLDYDMTVDIYSLGLVLFKFLNNNRMPFLSIDSEQIRYSEKERANALRFSGERIPKPCNADEKLAEIILKACAFNPKDRYQSPKLMRQDLQKLLLQEANGEMYYPQESKTSGCDSEAKKEAATNNRLQNDSTVRVNSLFVEDKTVITSRHKNEILHTYRVRKVPFVSDNASDEIRKKSNRTGKRTWIGIISSIVLVISFLFLGIVLFEKDKPMKVVVKDLRNMQISEAEELLKKENLLIEKTYATSKNVEKDHIISQEEMFGMELDQGSTIHVVVSSAKLVQVPNVVNERIDQAKSILEGVGMLVEIKEIFSDDAESGTVVEQNPQQGDEVEPGYVVELTISKGAELIEMPKVVGLEKKEALERLSDLGISASVEEKYSNSSKKGFVISQDIPEKKKVSKGTIVYIMVSKGQKKQMENTVPNNASEVNNNVKPEYKNESESGDQNEDDEIDFLDEWELIN